MNCSGQTVSITGAGRGIGSHLCEGLVRQGAHLRALVRYNGRGTYGSPEDSSPELRRSLEVVQGDLRDPDIVERVVTTSEYVFHLGAFITIPYSYRAPTEATQVVGGTQNIRNACRKAQSPNCATKIVADKLVESYTRALDVPAVTLPSFGTYGPRQSARAVLPTIIVQLLGKTLILGSLTPTRDFTLRD